MTPRNAISRRSLLAMAGAVPLAPALAAKKIPIGLELYSVRNELRQDLFGTVRAVAKMGYEGVEFFSPYFEWTTNYAMEVRKLLDDLKLPCFSTHNGANAFEPQNLDKAIELNQILGSRLIVMASAGRVTSLDGWKAVADRLNAAAEKMKPLNMRAGFHNHQVEFRPLQGQKPIELLASKTTRDVVLQFDVGTCLDAGSDPVAWIAKNPGRIRSIHLKEWSKEKGYKVLFGEGEAPWKKILREAERSGGVEHYLIEQEGSEYAPLETVERCLKSFRKLWR